MLAYLPDPEDPGLVAETSRIRSERSHRAQAIVAAIAADYDLTWDDVLAQTSPGTTIGRPHIADALVARGGRHAEALGRHRAVRSARNRVLCPESTALADGDEVGFFPPVTGG